jgi:hypothetical protein
VESNSLNFKINWDAAIDSKKGVVGVGVIARDAQGCCVSAYGVTANLKVSPAAAEAFAALQRSSRGLSLKMMQ